MIDLIKASSSRFEASVLWSLDLRLCFQGLVLVYVTVVLVVMARQFRFLNNIDQVNIITTSRNFE